MAKRKAARRELIDTGTDKLYVRRDASGRFKESDDVGRSIAKDRERKARREQSGGKATKGIDNRLLRVVTRRRADPSVPASPVPALRGSSRSRPLRSRFLCGRLLCGFRFSTDALRQMFSSCLAILLLESFIRDFAFHEQLCKFATLRLALEGHHVLPMRAERGWTSMLATTSR